MKPRVRLFVLAALTALSTFGVPGQARAEWIPRTLGDTMRVAPVVNGSFEREVALPWRANSVGVSFADKHATAFTLSLRAHTDAGWSDWTDLEAQDNGPDASSAEHARGTTRTVTEPMWIGCADSVA